MVQQRSLPALSECKDHRGVLANQVQKQAAGAFVDLVQIDDHFVSRSLLSGEFFLQRLQEQRDDHGVVVDDDRIRAGHLDNVRELSKAVALFKRLLHRRCVNAVDVFWKRAVILRDLSTALETKVHNIQMLVRREVLDHVVGDLAVASELLGVSADEKDFLLWRSRRHVCGILRFEHETFKQNARVFSTNCKTLRFGEP